MKRSTTFGFGKKLSFPIIRKNIPSPDAYKIPSDFNNVKNVNHGFSFGISYNDYDKHILRKRSPGPGDYSEMKVMGACGNKYSLKSRLSTSSKFIN